jgi:multidrug efflux pump subunit AcrA (membrane-fusion protein)
MIKNISTLFALLLFCIACGKKQTEEIPLGTATRGTFFIDMYEEGEIEAVNSINVQSPTLAWRYGNLKITQLIKDGQDVVAGDTMMVFDPSEVQKAIVEAEARLEISLAELEKLNAQHQSDLEGLKADYEVTKISQEISKIRLESASFESVVKKQEIQLNWEQAEIALDKAKEQIENTIKIQKEDIKQKDLEIQQDRTRLRESYETLNRLVVVTPSPGIAIVSRNWSSGTKFQIGDQCWSGITVIKLPDLSSLKALVKINEVDISKLKTGLKVEIKPDAFSDSVFVGTVSTIANLAVNKEGTTKVKVFPVEILMEGTHKSLLPGLSVSCRIIIDKMEDVLYVPIDAVHQEGDVYFVYKKSGSSYKKTEVETGISNSDYIIINSGLEEKDQVALIDPIALMKEEKAKKE